MARGAYVRGTGITVEPRERLTGDDAYQQFRTRGRPVGILGRLGAIEAHWTAVLVAEGFPTTWGMYRIADDGALTLAESAEDRDAPGRFADLATIATERAGWDSRAGFAARALQSIAFIRAAIDRGDALMAADFALDLGRDSKAAELKFNWGPDALHGSSMRSSGSGNLAKHNATRRLKTDALYDAWQTVADEIWRDRPKHLPDLSKRAVAILVAQKRNLGEAPGTIEKHIRKQKA